MPVSGHSLLSFITSLTCSGLMPSGASALTVCVTVPMSPPWPTSSQVL